MSREKQELSPLGLKLIASILAVLLGVALLASCGGEDDEAPTPTALPPSPVPTAVPSSTPEPRPTAVPILPCFTDLSAAHSASSLASATPEVIEIRMLEKPYRIEPSDIVVKQHQPYLLVIQGGNEWHQFALDEFGLNIVLPPGGQGTLELRADLLGAYRIKDLRKIPESHHVSTLTVIPANMSIDSWHEACADFQVHFPTAGAVLSAPMVIEGSVGPVGLQVFGGALHVTRIEAWSDGELVGTTANGEISFSGRHSDFQFSVPSLAPGQHTLAFRAYLQNGMLVATASLPLTVTPDAPATDEPKAFRGRIDYPDQDTLLGLPVMLRGWAVVFGSTQGTGVGAVEIWHGPRETGQLLGEAVHGTYRPDVAQIFDEPRFASGGWNAKLSDLPAGPLELHLYARDRETGAYVAPFEGEEIPPHRITLAEGKVADAPWPVALAAAPDGRLFFAELLTGRIRVWQEGRGSPGLFAQLEDVSTHGESGLLGLALHPDFAQNPFVYAMYVVENPETGLPLMQRVVRFRDVNRRGEDYTVVLDNLPATRSATHNGGRLAFGPDGKLYVTIGDLDIAEFAQDTENLAGSILRYNPDGSVPADNPLAGSPIYAYGLRNNFGLAFQPGTGSLYATENGPGGYDEVNKIEAGRNYGWPDHLGVANADGYVDPIAVFGLWQESPTYGPTGAAFPQERPDLFLFCAYHNPALHALQLRPPDYTTVERQLVLSKNCILDVTAGYDGWLYYSSFSAIYRAKLDDLLRLSEQQSVGAE